MWWFTGWIIFWNQIYKFRSVKPELGGPGGPLPPPQIFRRSVNPITTGEGRLSPPITSGTPKIFHLPTSLQVKSLLKLHVYLSVIGDLEHLEAALHNYKQYLVYTLHYFKWLQQDKTNQTKFTSLWGWCAQPRNVFYGCLPAPSCGYS